ncbi:MAG: hypothetical protein CV090_15775 [Nitrospira sp. WS238]|nr:hypothetical protein [Nitrospira sp. WS238]
MHGNATSKQATPYDEAILPVNRGKERKMQEIKPYSRRTMVLPNDQVHSSSPSGSATEESVVFSSCY